MNAKLLGLFSGFPAHHFTDEIAEVLRGDLTERHCLVFISAWPDAYEQNDDDSNGMHAMFAERGLAFDEHPVIDRRTSPSDAQNAVGKADCVFLMGGDPMLQIGLIRDLGLDHELQDSEAVILGVSAGAMNMGRYVADVWETGTWYEGLGLTDISIKAHYSEGDPSVPILKELSMIHPLTVMEDESAIFLKGRSRRELGIIHRIDKGGIVTIPANRNLLKNNYDFGDKIIVIGCSGSGKSTFSNRLHEVTRLPLIHLDNIWWKKDRSHISREEFDKKLDEILQGDKWIIDGDYSRTYEVRFKACDTVIFLDFSFEECMSGIKERVGKIRSDIPWTEQELDPELVKLVERYGSDNRPVVLFLMEKYSNKNRFIFESRSAAEEWLNKLR